MKKQDEIIYPVTEETMHAYAKSIFDPIIKGECVTTVWVPMAGRRKWNKFIIENISFFSKELPDYTKYILTYVEPLDLTEESLIGYLRLIGESFLRTCKKHPQVESKITNDIEQVFDVPGATYSQLLDALRKVLLDITDLGLEVVFFLGEFDELSFSTKIFYKNLKSLWVRLYPRLHYIFLMTKIVDSQDYYYTWDELGEAILQNVVYVRLESGKDIDYLLSDFAKAFNISLPDEASNIIKEVCGGHPYSLKVAMRILRDISFKTSAEYRSLLFENYELQSISTGIYERRSAKEKEILQKIARNEDLTEEENKILQFLFQLGLVEINEGKKRFFSTLFSKAIEKTIMSQNNFTETKYLTFDEHSGAIMHGGKTVEERFTRQEYSILVLFLKSPEKVLTRDDIGAVLWGESSYEKYSDWAIDQLMSKLRKKLKEAGIFVEIHTLRGRGYKLSQNLKK